MARSKIKFSDESAILEAAHLLKSGQVIVFPTETVYGLGADAANPSAIDKIFQIKGRQKNQPLQILVENISSAQKLAIFNQRAKLLAEHFWPGPLTLVLPRTANCPVPRSVSLGGDTIGIRIPAHDTALKLLRLFGKPLASTSANFSGKESSVNASEAANSIGNLVPFIIDGGRCSLGVASTVVSLVDDEMRILRAGAISENELLDAIGAF